MFDPIIAEEIRLIDAYVKAAAEYSNAVMKLGDVRGREKSNSPAWKKRASSRGKQFRRQQRRSGFFGNQRHSRKGKS